MTEAERKQVLALRFLVGDHKGIHHTAYRGASGIVGFTLCRIGIKFKNFVESNRANWRYMRILKHGKLNCVDCIAVGDEPLGSEVVLTRRKP